MSSTPLEMLPFPSAWKGPDGSLQRRYGFQVCLGELEGIAALSFVLPPFPSPRRKCLGGLMVKVADLDVPAKKPATVTLAVPAATIGAAGTSGL